MQKTLRLVAIGSLLLFFACICYSIYCDAVHHAVRDNLVDEWLDIAIERRRWEGVDAASVMITPEEYETYLTELSEREQRLVFHTEFPNGKTELRDFLLSRVTGNYHSLNFWSLIFVSGVGFASAVAWLHGHATGVSSSKNSNIALDDEA